MICAKLNAAFTSQNTDDTSFRTFIRLSKKIQVQFMRTYVLLKRTINPLLFVYAALDCSILLDEVSILELC